MTAKKIVENLSQNNLFIKQLSNLQIGGSGEITTDPDSTRVALSDGVEMTTPSITKVLINGRMENKNLPTYEFQHTVGELVRLISAAAEAPLEFTVDEHVITVIGFGETLFFSKMNYKNQTLYLL